MDSSAVVDSSAIKTLLSTIEAYSYTVLYIGFWLKFCFGTHTEIMMIQQPSFARAIDRQLFSFLNLVHESCKSLQRKISGLAQTYAAVIRAHFPIYKSSCPALSSSSQIRKFAGVEHTLQEGSCSIAQFGVYVKSVFLNQSMHELHNTKDVCILINQL